MCASRRRGTGFRKWRCHWFCLRPTPRQKRGSVNGIWHPEFFFAEPQPHNSSRIEEAQPPPPGGWAARERAQESRQRLTVAREDDKDEEQQSVSVYVVEGFGSAWEDGVEFYGLCAYIGGLTGKVIYHLDQSSWKYRPPDQDFQTFDQFRGATLSQVRNEKGRYKYIYIHVYIYVYICIHKHIHTC
jgi:hypothetical protein